MSVVTVGRYCPLYHNSNQNFLCKIISIYFLPPLLKRTAFQYHFWRAQLDLRERMAWPNSNRRSHFGSEDRKTKRRLCPFRNRQIGLFFAPNQLQTSSSHWGWRFDFEEAKLEPKSGWKLTSGCNTNCARCCYSWLDLKVVWIEYRISYKLCFNKKNYFNCGQL